MAGASVVLIAIALLLAPRSGDPTLGAEGPTGHPLSNEVTRIGRPTTPVSRTLVEPPPQGESFQSLAAQPVALTAAGASLPSGEPSPSILSSGPSLAFPSASPSVSPLASWSPSMDPSASPAPSPSPSPAPSLALAQGSRPYAAPPTSAEPEDLKGYKWPLYQGRMTNFFGAHYTGFLVVDGQRIHPGLDTTTFCGDRVRAAHAGVVVAVGRRFSEQIGYGGPLDEFYRKIHRRHSMYMQPIVVVVDDGNGYRSMYVHLEKALVKVGDRVRHKTVIGLEGRTGNADGCHVHYELIRMDGPWMRVAGELVKRYGYPAWERERVDPLRVLDLKDKRAGRFVPGLERPKLPPSLRPSRSPSP